MVNIYFEINNNCRNNIFSMIIVIIAIIIFFTFKYFPNNSKKDPNLTIIGIDFGSSFSGYSILTDGIIDFESHDKNKIFYSEVILDRETKYGHKIGNESHHSRFSLAKNELYFSHFKKFLDKNHDYEDAFIESDIPKGEKVRLEYVIKGFLEILIRHVEEDLEHLNLNLIHTKWLITAPCFWNDIGKNYLKKIAHKAHMFNTEILLEPEAISLAIFHDKYINKEDITPGTKYLIVDAGGYTVDISFNKILKNNNVEQLAPPLSFHLGSNLINEKIIDIIKEVFGEENVMNFAKNKTSAWENILEQIEESKNNINSIDSDNIKLNIEFNKLICYKEEKNYYGKTYFTKKDDCYKIYNGNKIIYNNEQLFLPKKFIIDILSDLSSKIITKINSYLLGRELNLVVLTGGFSNSKILRKKINQNFKRKNIKVVFLKAPQETVMRGAAIYGILPNKILYRVSPVSILIDSYEYKKENKECEFKEYKDENGKLICLKFIRFIKSFQSIKTDDIIKKLTNPIFDEISIYYTYGNELNIDDIHLLDTVEIPYSDLPLKKRKIMVYMKFSNYINVTIKDVDSNNENSKVIYYPTQKDD